MIDAPTQQLLQDILRREGRSVLTYVAEAYPWASLAEEKTLTDLQKLIAAEREAVASLGRFLVRRRIPPPYLPPYPAHFTIINYLALDFLLPRLIDYEKRSIADLERDRAALKDSEAQMEVEKLLALKRRHLARLEEMASAQPQARVS